MNIEDKYQLLAVHRAFMEARFSDNPNDPNISGSPILAEIHRNLISELVSHIPPVGGSSEQWHNWLLLTPERREWKIAVGQTRQSSWWPKLTYEEKLDSAKNLLSPFTLSDSLIEEFVRTIDGVSSVG